MSFLFTLFRPVFRTPHVLDVWNLKFCQHSDLGTLLLNYVPRHSICVSSFYMRQRGGASVNELSKSLVQRLSSPF